MRARHAAVAGIVTRPVEATLFASLDPPRLAGSRCASCGCVAFPPQDGCARCAGADLDTVALPERGTLWTSTVQTIAPKPPYRAPVDGFVPFAVGYVHLGEVIVESRLVGGDGAPAIGAEMELTLLPLWTDDDGDTVVTYAFRPGGSAP